MSSHHIFAPIDRRRFLKGGTETLLVLGAPWPWARLASSQERVPHFFLNIVIAGGIDARYFFDAKPIELTENKRHVNYLYKNGNKTFPDPRPIPYTGVNGNSALRTLLVDSLVGLDFKSAEFSVINGVHMAPPTNLSHGTNLYYMFTNSPLPKGISFVPSIGALSDTPLESVHFGGWKGDGNQAPSNFGRSVQIQGTQSNLFSAVLRKPDMPKPGSKLAEHIHQRFVDNGNGAGMYRAGSAQAADNFSKVPQLADTLSASLPSVPGETSFMTAVRTALLYFQSGVTSTATVILDGDPKFDTHSSEAAKNISLYEEVVNEVKSALDALKNTEFKNGQSMMKQTTFMISTEFSRTNLQPGRAFESCGTDHNPYTNTILIGGKGIRTGCIVGASDVDQSTFSNMNQLSGAHRAQEPANSDTPIYTMGKPYDFKEQKVSTNLPESYVRSDYICFSSVANTLLDRFGLKTNAGKLRLETGETAPIISELLG